MQKSAPGRFDRFDHAVRRRRGRLQRAPQPCDRLMVAAVDPAGVARCSRRRRARVLQARTRRDRHVVRDLGLGLIDRVSEASCRLPTECPARACRRRPRSAPGRRGRSRGSARRASMARRARSISNSSRPGSASATSRVTLLAIQHRIHIAAAGEHQAVDLADDLARAVADFEDPRTAAGLLDRRRRSRPSCCSG